MLDDDERPIISPNIVVHDTLILIALSGPGIEVRFTGSAAVVLRKMLPQMAGQLTIRQIRAQTGLSRESFSEVFGALAGEGYITDVRDLVQGGDSECQLNSYFGICDAWAAEIFERPFWGIFLGGNASKEQILGWGSEFYHRTTGADVHNLVAVRNCQCPQMNAGLRDHYEEELGHGEIFLRALAACGVDAENLRRSVPIPTTQRLISYMSELARRDSWGYLGCYGILHSPRVGQTPEAASHQFDAFSLMYPACKPLFEAFLDHTLLDLNLGHDQILLESLIRARGRFSEDEALRAIRGAWGMTRVFSGFFDGILDHC